MDGDGYHSPGTSALTKRNRETPRERRDKNLRGQKRRGLRKRQREREIKKIIMEYEQFMVCSLSRSDFIEAYGLLCVEDTENMDESQTVTIDWDDDDFLEIVKEEQRKYRESAGENERELYIKVKGLPKKSTVIFLVRLLQELKNYQSDCVEFRCRTRFVVAANERQRMHLVMLATQPANDHCCVTPAQWIKFFGLVLEQSGKSWN